MAATAITRDTRAVAVVVSESAVVRIFDGGRLVSEIIPEIWRLGKERSRIDAPREEKTVADLRIVSVRTDECEEDR